MGLGLRVVFGFRVWECGGLGTDGSGLGLRRHSCFFSFLGFRVLRFRV